jgi:hypothetical protein
MQMSLGQQQPVVPGALDQASTRLHQSLLEARQRLGVDPLRQHRPTPQVAHVVGQQAQLEACFIGPEPMTRQPGPMRRLLAFLDPLLGLPTGRVSNSAMSRSRLSGNWKPCSADGPGRSGPDNGWKIVLSARAGSLRNCPWLLRNSRTRNLQKFGSRPPHFSTFPWLKTTVIPTCDVNSLTRRGTKSPSGQVVEQPKSTRA